MEKRNCLTSDKSIQRHWGEASVDKGLSCKHGLGLSQHPHENSGYSGVCLQPQYWGSRNRRTPGVLATQYNQMGSFSFSERPCLNKQGGEQLKKTPWHASPHMKVHAHMQRIFRLKLSVDMHLNMDSTLKSFMSNQNAS